MEDELKEYRVKPNSVIKITSKEINSSNECFIICVGILRGSSGNFLPIKYIKDNDKLVIGFETFILSVNYQTLDKFWILNEYTDVLCIEKYEEDYIAYDEVTVERIDKRGNVKWSFHSIDHFVSYRGTENFIFYDTYIKMIDSNEVVYRISYEGEDLDNIRENYFEKESNNKNSCLTKFLNIFKSKN